MDWEIDCTIRHRSSGSGLDAIRLTEISFYPVRSLGARPPRRILHSFLHQPARDGLRRPEHLHH